MWLLVQQKAFELVYVILEAISPKYNPKPLQTRILHHTFNELRASSHL